MNKKINNETVDKFKLAERIESILKSSRRHYEKKLALFNFVKDLEVEETPEEQKRVNYLLESCLLNQMAKQSMKEYKKTTAENFSKTDKERYGKNYENTRK